MNFNTIFKTAFSDLSALSDNDTILTNIIERAENMKKNKMSFRKVILAAAAAVAVLTAATVTVGAVTGWNFNAAFSAIFSKGDDVSVQTSDAPAANTSDLPVTSAEAVADTNDTQTAAFNFEAYGKVLDQWYDMDGYALNIKGISADKVTAYLLYDIIFDEGYDYAPRDGWTDWCMITRLDALEAGESEAPVTRATCSEDIISQQGNVLSGYSVLRLTDINDTLQGKTVTVDFGDLRRMLPNNSEKDPEPWKDIQLLSCGIHLDIPIDFEICTEEHTITMNEKIEFHDFNGTADPPAVPAEIKYFSYTPFSWELFIALDTSDFEKGDGYLIDLTLHLKDGTSIDVDHYYTFCNTESGSVYRSTFAQPIAPEQITHITVSEHTYNWNL